MVISHKSAQNHAKSPHPAPHKACRFYQAALTPPRIEHYPTLVRDAREPEKVALLQKVWRQRLSYRLVRSAEECKIALSSVAETRASLLFISNELATLISQRGLESALSQPLARILEQVQLALDNAQEKPDVIYLTGGSARSPLIKKALAEQLPGIPIAGGDDFGSVTAGLARWAEVVFR